MELQVENVAAIALFPDAKVFVHSASLAVTVNGAAVFEGPLPDDRQLRLVQAGGTWRATLEARQRSVLTGYRTNPAGTVDIVDLIQCSRPFDQLLVTAEFKGRDLVEIIDANVQDPLQLAALPPERRHTGNRLVQVAGMRRVQYFQPRLLLTADIADGADKGCFIQTVIYCRRHISPAVGLSPRPLSA